MDEGAWGLSTGSSTRRARRRRPRRSSPSPRRPRAIAASTPATSAAKARRSWTRCARRSGSGARPIAAGAGEPRQGGRAARTGARSPTRWRSSTRRAPRGSTSWATSIRTPRRAPRCAPLLPDWALEGGRRRDAQAAGRSGRARADPGELEDPANTGTSLLRADAAGSTIMISWCPSARTPRAIGSPRSRRRGASIRSTPSSSCCGDADGVASMILFQLDEADLRRALVHPARHDRLRRLGARPVRREGRRQAASAQLRHVPARARPVRARAARALARRGRAQDDRRCRRAAWACATAARSVRARGPTWSCFDPRTVADQATYDDPHRYPVGIEHVLVNGRFVIKDGRAHRQPAGSCAHRSS